MTNDNEFREITQSLSASKRVFGQGEMTQIEHRLRELKTTACQPELPNGFFFDNERWLVFQKEGNKDDIPVPIKICSRLEVVARTRDDANENHGRLLQFDDPDGVSHTWPMPMELLAGDGLQYRQALLSKGLLLASGSAARQLLTMYIQMSSPNRTARCVQQTGWARNQRVFVLPEGIVGDSGDEPLILQSTTVSSFTDAIAGSLVEWQQLARLCDGNSRLIFALSAAFAGPLLLLLGVENGGFHFRGHSTSGKTTCLRVAASVWGGPSFMKQWRATANGLEGVAAAHNDCLLCLDEIGEIDSMEVGKVAYMLANGTGKTRADRYGNPRDRAKWRLVFLSSGEKSLLDHMSDGKQKIKAGQEIRILDIPVDTQTYGCFNELHGFLNPKAFADHLNELSRKSYGLAGRSFLRSLIESKDNVLEMARALMTDLPLQNLPPNASSQISRAFHRFAMVAVAGELASVFGITGWKEGTAIKAAMRCFDDWLRARGTLGLQEEQQILSQVRYYFEQHGEGRFSAWTTDGEDPKIKTLQRAGYRKCLDGDVQFYVFQESFKRDLCSGLDARLVIDVCLRHGWLMPGPNGTPTRSERLPGAKQSVRVYRFTSKVLEDGAENE